MLNVVVSTITVFFGPAEAAMIPFLVPKKQLLAANGVFTLTLNAAFAIGFALLGPVVVALFGAPALILDRGRLLPRRRRVLLDAAVVPADGGARRRSATGHGWPTTPRQALGSTLSRSCARGSPSSAPTARSAGR